MLDQNLKKNEGSGDQNSGVAIPPRSRMRETDAVSSEKIFEYLGYHFVAIGISEYSISLSGNHQYALIEWCSPALCGIHNSLYSQKSFIETAKTSVPDVDVYYCRETAKYYIPGVRNLFEYRGRIHSFLRREEDVEAKPIQKSDGLRKEKAPVLSLKL